jgi:hypothetical protein
MKVNSDRNKNSRTPCFEWRKERKTDELNSSILDDVNKIDPYIRKLHVMIQKIEAEGRPTEVLQRIRLFQISKNRTSFLQATDT